jgi:hypothetical protein
MNAELREAVERMCTPLDESRLSGATAKEDARCMAIIAKALRDQEAEIAKLNRLLERAQCYHRCSRIHPHCQLKIARIGAPDHLWFWTVTMPDGHCYATSGAGKSFDSMDECMSDAQTNGRKWLEQADTIWRESHPRITAHLGGENNG